MILFYRKDKFFGALRQCRKSCRIKTYTPFPEGPYTGRCRIIWEQLFSNQMVKTLIWRIIEYEVYRFGTRKKILSAYR